MKCPCCGAAELIHDARDVSTSYKGESTTIFSVTDDFCPACAEIMLNQAHGDRYSALVGQFQQQVNAAFVDADFVAKVLKTLNLGQREAADIFGGGVNAFSRYENGGTKPPLALLKLLKVVDRHPDLLGEVRSA